jgi:C-terminal processing protease CtpA/Prc
MIGELNSSHTGIVAGQDAARPPVTGRLGIALDPSDNDIVSVTPLGPADVAGIKAGEKLISIDGIPLSPQTNLDELLQHKIGKRTICRTSAHENAVVLPVNQNTLSDSEDFTEGYRAVKLGKVVGTPTAGWIIYTGQEDLIDGSALRTPGVRITGAGGTDMELHPRPVDIQAERPVGESYTGRDAQLEAAVKALFAELPAGVRR